MGFNFTVMVVEANNTVGKKDLSRDEVLQPQGSILFWLNDCGFHFIWVAESDCTTSGRSHLFCESEYDANTHGSIMRHETPHFLGNFGKVSWARKRKQLRRVHLNMQSVKCVCW